MLKKFLFVVGCSLIVGATTQAQSKGYSYKTALGVKFWNGAGVTFKTFVAPEQAVEVIGYFYKDGTRITGLYEFHGDVNGAKGLKWYAGPGVHVGFYDAKGTSANNTFAGIDGVLGLDLKINRAPINLALDWQPSFEFGNNRGFVGSWGGFAVRYTF